MLTFHDAIRAVLPKSVAIPILAGPAKGLRWYPRVSDVTAYWRGTYEREEVERFAAAISPGMVVYDIGAHCGYYSLVASRRVGASGHVYAFEPTPQSCDAVRRHIEKNRLWNVTCREEALSDADTMLPFRIKVAPMENGLITADPNATGHTVMVYVRSIDSLVARGAIKAPSLIKMDAEGVEHQVLAGARATITAHRPTLFLSLHDPVSRQSSIDILASWGYALTPLDRLPLDQTYELLATPMTSSARSVE